MIGVHVLAQKRDLTHAALNKVARFGENTVDRARYLGTACIRHNAESAELVTAFLNGEKSCWAASGLGARGKMLEFIIDGEVCIESLFAREHFGLHFWQAVIALGANDKVYHRLPAHDFCAFGLGHTASDTDLQIGAGVFEGLVAAQLGIDFFGGFFADVASVEQDHVRVFRRVCLFVAFEGFGHALTVIDVHLATIGLDEELFGACHRRVSCVREFGR